jgi:hypothetical protein
VSERDVDFEIHVRRTKRNRPLTPLVSEPASDLKRLQDAA